MRPQSKPFTVETKKRRRRADEQTGLDLLGTRSGMASLRSMAAEVGLNGPADSGDTSRRDSRPQNLDSSGIPMLLKPSSTPDPTVTVTRILPDLASGGKWPTLEEGHQSTASKPRKRRATTDLSPGESRRFKKRVIRPSAQHENSAIRKPVKDIPSSAPAVIERPLQAPDMPPGSVRININSKRHRRKPSQELSARELRRAIVRGVIKVGEKGPGIRRHRKT
jgi:hypothetical protein